MLRRVRRYQHARCSVLVVKYEGDTRYSAAGSVSTHDRLELPAVRAACANFPAHPPTPALF